MKRLPGPVDEPGVPLFTRLMRHHQYTSRDLAAMCGVSKNAILRVAHGKEPSVSLGIKLAKIFRISVEDLWGQ